MLIWHHYGTDWAGGIMFGFFGFIFWILMIWLLISFLHGHNYRHHHLGHQHTEDPLEIAKARYAKGEITKEEFDRLKKDIS